MLVVAGILEAYVTPHFSQPVRWAVAFVSALVLSAYLGLAGRRNQPFKASEHSAKSEF